MPEPAPGDRPPPPGRPSLPARLLPWVELIAKLLAAIAAALAITKGIG